MSLLHASACCPVHFSSKALLIAADVCALPVPLRISKMSEHRPLVGVVDLHDSVAWFGQGRPACLARDHREWAG